MPCPMCGKGTLRKGKVKEYMFGEYLGEYPALICSACKESFTDSATTKKIEAAAKRKGIWGLGAKTNITRVGNSLAVRIPKRLAEHLKLTNGKEVYLFPDKNKLIVERKYAHSTVTAFARFLGLSGFFPRRTAA
jgi:YgiT-type zinc finger domain-containing protein